MEENYKDAINWSSEINGADGCFFFRQITLLPRVVFLDLLCKMMVKLFCSRNKM